MKEIESIWVRFDNENRLREASLPEHYQYGDDWDYIKGQGFDNEKITELMRVIQNGLNYDL